MLNRLRFALGYAFRNMWRDQQRTAFALFSIAAGVATVVALRMLGLMLTDALTSNVQAFLRGDIVIQGAFRGPTLSFTKQSPVTPINGVIAGTLNKWAAQN